MKNIITSLFNPRVNKFQTANLINKINYKFSNIAIYGNLELNALSNKWCVDFSYSSLNLQC